VHGDLLVSVNYSWLAAKHRLQAWIELLALTVTRPERSWRAVSVGRGKPSSLGPVPAVWAARVLADLLDLYRTGLSEPLPLGPKTACEYARIRCEGKSVQLYSDKLSQLWNEERDSAYERLLGAGVTFDQVLQVPSVRGEERGDLAEPSRFGTLARRVWHPLLESEVLR
jgi:exodeoxyribonuclease V gamma subunit